MFKQIILITTILLVNCKSKAQSNYTIQSKSAYVTENLDLEALLEIYEGSSTLNDFEKKINNPDFQVSNIDLDNDEKIDYLRVINKKIKKREYSIIQSKLSANKYEDVAIIHLKTDPDTQLSFSKKYNAVDFIKGTGKVVFYIVAGAVIITYAVIRSLGSSSYSQDEDY